MSGYTTTRPQHSHYDPYAYHRAHPRPTAASVIDFNHGGPSGSNGDEYDAGGAGAGGGEDGSLAGLLGWEGLQRTMQMFLTAIDTYAHTSKTELARRASDHHTTLRGLEQEKVDLESYISEEREKESRMLKSLEQERISIQSLEQSLSRLNASLGGLKDRSTALEGEVARVKGEVGSIKGEKERQRATLLARAAEDEPELATLEDLLGWKVMGVKEEGVIMMSFSRIDPERPDKEFSLLLDLSRDPFTVTNCSIPLPVLHDLVTTLNADRNVGAFVKRARQALRATFLDVESSSADLFKGVGSLGSAGVGGGAVGSN